MLIENKESNKNTVWLHDVKHGQTFYILGDSRLYLRVNPHKADVYGDWFNAINLETGKSAISKDCECILTNHVAVEK